LAGCGSSQGPTTAPTAPTATRQAAQVPPAVAWASIIPAELRAPPLTTAAPCRASELRVQGGGIVFQATVVGASGTVELRNAGSRPCRLTGRPLVRFIGAPRSPRQRQTAEPALSPEFPAVSRPASSLRAVAPGSDATLSVDWNNWCPPGRPSSKPVMAPKAMRVTLPGGGGSIDISYNAVTPCFQPGSPSTIGVRPFEPEILPNGQPWSRIPLTARVLTAAGAPASTLRVARGSTLRYVVELHNASTNEMLQFGNCPLFVQELAPKGSIEAYRLNCAAAHSVRPGGSIRFDVQMPVPSNAPVGDNGLFWELDPVGVQGPEATARVMVS
jgi:hypothetical protein